MDYLLYYNTNTGAGAIGQIDAAGNPTTLKGYDAGAFSTGWTDIVATHDHFLTYNTHTGAGGTGKVDDLGNFTTLQSYPAGAFSTGWTHFAATHYHFLSYNIHTGAGGTGKVDESGNFTTLKSYPNGFFSTWTHIAGTKDYLLYYNANTGAGAVGQIDALGNPTTLKSYPEGSFSTGWTHIVATSDHFLAYNANTGAGGTGQIDAVGNYIHLKAYNAGSFSTGCTHVVATQDRFLFYNINTGAGGTGKVDESGNFITLKSYPERFFSTWTHINLSKIMRVHNGMTSLKQAIEWVREREGFPPPGIVSIRQLLLRYSLTPASSVRALLASVLIGQRYELDGRSAGQVGIPMGNVRLTADGAVQPFSGGYMVLRNKKVDPIVAFQAEVRFLGFRCIEESDHDQLTSSDEPYFIIGITGLNANVTKTFGPFEDVESGESHFTTSENDVLVRDVQPPFTLSVLAMEHDKGNPKEASDKVKRACEDAIRITQTVAAAFGQAQVVAVTVALNSIFTAIGGPLADVASAVLGLGDDFVGSNNIRVGDWNDGSEEWKTPPRITEEPMFSESPYNWKVNVGEDGEGKYTLYFNINMRKVTSVPV